MMKPEQHIFNTIFPRIQTLFKYYQLKKHHRISMQVFQEQMTQASQELLQLCTFYEEVENRGAQWELLYQHFLQNKGGSYGTKNKYRKKEE